MTEFWTNKIAESNRKPGMSYKGDPVDPAATTPANTMSGGQIALAGASIFSSLASMFSAWSASKTEKKLYAIQARMQELQAQLILVIEFAME